MLAIEEDDIIVDLAGQVGAQVGDDIELWRPLKLRHPVTRKVVEDRYRIGSLRLTQVRPSIALGRVQGTPLRKPAVGDLVVGTRVVTAPVVAGEPSARPAAAQPVELAPGDLEGAAVCAMFEQLRGASLTQRIKRYERQARRFPDGRYARTLLEEAAALRELVAAREHPAGAAGPAEAPGPMVARSTHPLTVIEGTPLSIGVDVSGAPVGAVLHARNAGEVAYRPTPMQRAGDGYFTATLPADRVVAPKLQYFVEAIRASGDAVAVLGTSDEPETTVVEVAPHAGAPLGHQSTVAVVTDLADYNRLRGDDRVFQTEGTFGMRFHDTGVRALRSGFGVYRGVGGSIRELDELGLPPREVGLTYGHLEGEFGLRPAFSIIARAVLGLRDDGTGGGAQAHLRFGSDLSTNLTVGGEVLGGIGLRGITQLEIAPRGKVPVIVRSEVTNQPAGTGHSGSPLQASGTSGVGVRGIVQVGYRLFDPLVIALRASYQGRTIVHAGPGVGGALEYRW